MEHVGGDGVIVRCSAPGSADRRELEFATKSSVAVSADASGIRPYTGGTEETERRSERRSRPRPAPPLPNFENPIDTPATDPSNERSSGPCSAHPELEASECLPHSMLKFYVAQSSRRVHRSQYSIRTMTEAHLIMAAWRPPHWARMYAVT